MWLATMLRLERNDPQRSSLGTEVMRVLPPDMHHVIVTGPLRSGKATIIQLAAMGRHRASSVARNDLRAHVRGGSARACSTKFGGTVKAVWPYILAVITCVRKECVSSTL